MKHLIWALGIAFGTSLAVGCTPSPEKVCGHIEELQDKAEKEREDDGKALKGEMKKLLEEIREKQRKECPKVFGALKEDSSDVYKCAAKCVMDSKDMDAMQKCDDKCDGLKDAYSKARKKAKGDGDDDTEKASKKKSDDDDDKAKKDDDDDSDKKKKKKSDDDE